MSTAQLDPDFLESVKAALARVSPRDLGPISADRPLTDLGLDSVSAVELMAQLEDAYDVTIDESALSAVTTFGDLQALIERLRAEP
jgi:acyl carrier protein